jgi:hypothetical protein
MALVLQVIRDTDRRGAQIVATERDGRLGARGKDVCTVALTAGGLYEFAGMVADARPSRSRD